MEYEWDGGKRLSNLEKHGVDFESFYDFEWDTALVQSLPFQGEIRYRALGYIGPRLHVVIYTMRGQVIRIISMWRGGRREENEYAQTEA